MSNIYRQLTALGDSLRSSMITCVLRKDVEGFVGGDIVIIRAGTHCRILATSRFGNVEILTKWSAGIDAYARVGGAPDTRNPGKIEDYFDRFTVAPLE